MTLRQIVHRYNGLRSHDLFNVAFASAHVWNAAGIKAPNDELWTAADFHPEVESEHTIKLDEIDTFDG